VSGAATRTASPAYDGLQDQAVLVDRSARLRMSVSGDKALEALGGLVTNDVASLGPLGVMRAVALTPKGRVIALVRVVRRAADVLVDTEAAAGEGFASMIKKFVNPRIAKHAVITSDTACLGIFGPAAARELARALPVDADAMQALTAAAALVTPDGTFTVLRSDALGAGGFDVIGPRAAVLSVRQTLETAGLPVMDDATLDVAEVERGLPRFGIEMDAETIPQEANLDLLDAISFNKGCYTGQEVVARIHFRGHVNRHLRRITASEPIERGDVVLDQNGKEVGDVRSAVLSPRLGWIAVAMVRREVEPGSEVALRRNDHSFAARCEVQA
jgi:folate-binding protein YgfZ